MNVRLPQVTIKKTIANHALMLVFNLLNITDVILKIAPEKVCQINIAVIVKQKPTERNIEAHKNKKKCPILYCILQPLGFAECLVDINAEFCLPSSAH